ncbi:unnamed protein product [Oikopleura dioica]|uniref:Uncharacterized protein n=1 Tax=Oikopleura dioica TaxID=34765 RepID=E4YG63_OIKDI|nr:unnamed protein product [Oikopleura dioica]
MSQGSTTLRGDKLIREAVSKAYSNLAKIQKTETVREMRNPVLVILVLLVNFTNQAALGKQHLCKLSKRIELCHGCHKILTTQISSENVYQMKTICKMVVLGCDGGCMAGKYLQLMISSRRCTTLTERDLCLQEYDFFSHFYSDK